MPIAIMQPYLFPYIGYWQLINESDTFVIFDDVHFVKKGYINRNSILINGKKQRFTLELMEASQNKLINEISVGNNARKILKTIEMNYKRAPFFNTAFPIIQNILEQDEKNLAKYIGYSLKEVSQYLGINTKFIYSSDIEKNNHLKAQEKILDICKKLKTTSYINTIGGKELYNKDIFKAQSIKLNFIQTQLAELNNSARDQTSNLSIIHIIMHNSKSEINIMLKKFKLT